MVSYPCEEAGCEREFSRQDARLKHYRKHHRHLALGDSLKHSAQNQSTSPIRGDGPSDYRTTYPLRVSNSPAQAMHVCDEPSCGRSFDRRAEMLRHQRIHLSKSERPHKCDACDEGFLYPKDLERHKRTHAEDSQSKIFCLVEGCSNGTGGTSFSRQDNLLRHMRQAHPGRM